MSAISFISPITNKFRNLYNKIPNITVAKSSMINTVEHIGKKWTSPQQRLIMGATAIFMQPLIDAKNKRVNNDTKKVSVAKTISKIIVGTATGFAIRYLSIKAVKAFSFPIDTLPQNLKPFTKRLKTFLSSSKLTSEMKDELAQYRNTMGTLLSLFIMLFTNFGIDAPWTNKLTNFLLTNNTTSKMLDKFVARHSKTKGENN